MVMRLLVRSKISHLFFLDGAKTHEELVVLVSFRKSFMLVSVVDCDLKYGKYTVIKEVLVFDDFKE